MKLTTKENSTNYTCTVVEIKDLYSIEGADRIQRCRILGNDVIVSKDVKVGDIMLYFPSGTKLNEEYCKKNNLYDKAEMNEDVTKRGFLSHRQSRIRAIKLRGIVSDGMLMPLESLPSFVNPDDLKVGDSFTDIGDFSLCEKYFVPVRNSNPGGKAPKRIGAKVQDVIIDNQFHFHHDTEHFAKNLNKFTPESEIVITRKYHGSSLILANVLVHKNLSFKEKVFNFFGANIPKDEYGFVWSSGKPKSKIPKGVESASNRWETPNPSFYTSDIWARAYSELKEKVEKGISIYAEIVGQGIQGPHFTYNLEYGIYVYRITYTNVDGQVYEFSWEQIKKYCEKYGINHVEEYFVGKVFELTTDNLLEHLQEKYLNKSYPDCQYDEGVCVRLRDSGEIFKLKSPNFILMENNAQENGETNLEDEAGEG